MIVPICGMIILIFACCWCGQCQKLTYGNGGLVQKCSCHKNRILCKKRTPKYRKYNSELKKASDRGVLSEPIPEIMKFAAAAYPLIH